MSKRKELIDKILTGVEPTIEGYSHLISILISFIADQDLARVADQLSAGDDDPRRDGKP